MVQLHQPVHNASKHRHDGAEYDLFFEAHFACHA